MTPARTLPGPRGHWLLGALPRLPGDIYIQRRGFTLYIPIVGSILVSLLLTLLLNLFFARR